MRIRTLLAILVMILGIQSQAITYWREADGLGGPVVDWNQPLDIGAFHPVRAFFESRMAFIKARLPQIKPKDRFEYLKSQLREIQIYRNQRPMLDPEDEIHMNIVIRSLLDIGNNYGFNLQYCSYYKKVIIRIYEPTASETLEPEDPAVIEALSVLEAMCRHI